MQFKTLPMIDIWGYNGGLFDIEIVTMERCTCI